MYINTYLDKIGEFINLCMEFVKSQSGFEEIENLSGQLRNPEQIEFMFSKDVEQIKSMVKAKEIPEKSAKDNLDRLRVYILTQLEKHYNLIPQLLDDTEKKVSVSFSRNGLQFPEKLRESLMRIIDEAEKELNLA